MSIENLHWKVVLSELRRVTEWFPAVKAILTQEGATFVIVPIFFWVQLDIFSRHIGNQKCCFTAETTVQHSPFISPPFCRGEELTSPTHRSHTNPPP